MARAPTPLNKQSQLGLDPWKAAVAAAFHGRFLALVRTISEAFILSNIDVIVDVAPVLRPDPNSERDHTDRVERDAERHAADPTA